MKNAQPVFKRFSSEFWRSEVTRSEERQKKFVDMAEESIRVYNAQKQVGILNDTERRLNSWWYCANTLLPAYYSSPPKAEVGLRKRTGGTIEELSAVILERNIQYNMDCGFNFDQVGYNVALQFLLTGRGVLWARYKSDSETKDMEIALFRAPDGSLIDEKGQPFDGDLNETRPGPGGLVLAKISIEEKKNESAILDVVQYCDYLCSDARNESEIEWRGRRAFLTRTQAENLFGAELSDTLHFDSYPERIQKDWNKDYAKFEGKAEIFEIWCQESDMVYWGHKGGEKFIIKSEERPIAYEGFYPCSVITQSVDPDSVIPVSDYAHCKDQILEIERLTTRIHAVTQAIRTNALYDSTLGLQVEQLMIGDLKMIPTMNWPSYKSTGGLAASIEFLDIAPFINALQQLQAARQTALEQLYETLKVSDLLRGTSEQYKSATANRLEASWSSLGLIVRQNMFAKFVSDAIGKLGSIIASQFEMEEIFEVADVDRLLQPLLPAPPQPQIDANGQMMPVPQIDPAMLMEGLKQRIVNLFRDDDRFNYRIKIASDSMVAVDQAQEQQEGAQLMQAAGDFFNQMKPLIEQYPPLLGFSIDLFQNIIKRFKGGKELDGIFTKALNQVGEIAKAKEEAAKQPPPPDPIMQEMQARMQIAQMEAQARIQATQMEMADAHEKNLLAAQEQQMKTQREQLTATLQAQKAQLEQYLAEQELGFRQQELQIKANAVQVDLMKVNAMAQSDEAKHQITAERNRLDSLLKVQELDAKQIEFRMAQSEKLMEERRLATEQQLEQIRLSMEMYGKSANTPQPSVKSSSKKRRAEVVNDENGNPMSIKISEEPVNRKLIMDDQGNLIGMELVDNG